MNRSPIQPSEMVHFMDLRCALSNLALGAPYPTQQGVQPRSPETFWDFLQTSLPSLQSWKVNVLALGKAILLQTGECLDPQNLHQSVSNHLLRRYDWIPRAWLATVRTESLRTTHFSFHAPQLAALGHGLRRWHRTALERGAARAG